MKARLGALALATLALTGCGGGDESSVDEPSQTAETVTAETVTVTATPQATGPPEQTPDVFTARDLVDLAGTAGLKVCGSPEDVSNSDDRALETLACFAFSEREQIFRVLASERDQRRELAELREIADYNVNLGKEDDYIVPSALAGIYDDGTAWLISAPIAELMPIVEPLNGTLADFSDLRTEQPKPTEPPKPVGPSTSFGEGTYLVGEDVASGLYRSGGPSPDDGRFCVVYASEKPDDLGTYLRGSTIKGPAVIELNDGEWVTSQFCAAFKLS